MAITPQQASPTHPVRQAALHEDSARQRCAADLHGHQKLKQAALQAQYLDQAHKFIGGVVWQCCRQQRIDVVAVHPGTGGRRQ